MTVYYVTISALTGLGYMAERKKGCRTAGLYPAAVLFAFVFLTSFRYAVGFDYFSYRNIYEMTAGRSIGGILHDYWYEPLFFVVCRIFSMAGCSFQSFLTCVNFFLAFSAVWFIWKNSKIPWMSVYFYITLQFLAYNMNLMRQSIAVCFFMAAYPFLRDRKIVPFACLIFAGGLCHNSLWFIFPLYFLLHIKFTWKSVVPLLAAALYVYLNFENVFAAVQPFLPAKYAAYPGSYFWYSSGFEYVVPSALYLFFIYIFRGRVDDKVRQIYLNSALYNFMISLFITRHFILERFAVYPFVFSLLALPDIAASYQDKDQNQENKRNYWMVSLLFLIFGMGYFLFAAAKGFHHVYPYVSLLDKSTTSPL